MKASVLIAAALLAAGPTHVLAADNGSHAEHAAKQVPGDAAKQIPRDGGKHVAQPAADAALGDGVVKKIDKAGGKLTVAHGPLPNGMPAMTMAFRVKDPGWLDMLREGQKIRFATDDVAGVMTIVRLEAAK
jgi:Cu(I)/Ag(I) efflux system periplasmic protein CusF